MWLFYVFISLDTSNFCESRVKCLVVCFDAKVSSLLYHDLDWVLDNCKLSIEAMKDKNLDNNETGKSLCNAILSVFRHDENLTETKKKEHACWLELQRVYCDKVQKKCDNIEVSEEQDNSCFKWEKVLEKRDTLDKDSPGYLLLSIYTMMPPAREDMNKVKIYGRFPDEKQLEEHPNCIVINKSGITLIYTEFKTKNAEVYMKELPEKLRNIVRKSLDDSPRDYLIVSPRTGKPFDKANKFDMYVNRIFKGIFEKAVTIHTLRHSFVDAIEPTYTSRIRTCATLRTP